MKKKFKLFATIGSLALAVCMMTIGVLAATQVTLTVTTDITFQASNIKASYAVQEVAPAATWVAPEALDPETDDEEFTSFNGTDASKALSAATLTETNVVYGYVITLRNDYTAGQVINVTVNTKPTTTTGFTVSFTEPAATINPGATTTITAYVTVVPASVTNGATFDLGCVVQLSLA